MAWRRSSGRVGGGGFPARVRRAPQLFKFTCVGPAKIAPAGCIHCIARFLRLLAPAHTTHPTSKRATTIAPRLVAMLTTSQPMLRQLGACAVPRLRALVPAPAVRPLRVTPVRAYQSHSRSRGPPQGQASHQQRRWPRRDSGPAPSFAAARRAPREEEGPVPQDTPYDEAITSPRVVIPLNVPEGALAGPIPLPAGWEPPPPKPKNNPQDDGSFEDAEEPDASSAKQRAGGGKGLSPPIGTDRLLLLLNRRHWWLAQVTLNSPVGYPIVRLVNKAEFREKARKLLEADARAAADEEANKGKVQPDQKLKEIRFTWSISDHDLTHKLERLINQSRQKGHKLGLEIKTGKGKVKEFYNPGALEARQDLLYKIDKMVIQDDPGTGFALVQNQGKTRWQNQTFRTLYEPTGSYRA